MAQDNTAQGQASTVALENLAEAITRATLRALDERQLSPSSAAGVSSGSLNIPAGPGGTVLGIIIPPWERDYSAPEGTQGGIAGLGPCRHHIILGIIIMPKDLRDLAQDAGGGTAKKLT